MSDLDVKFPFDNGYGSFGEDGWSYRIRTPKTPRPWVNVISNGTFGLILSQAGGGYSWRENAQLNRITRWEQDLIKDEWGKFLYVRDADSGKFWSAAWKPVCVEPESYLCTHGIGYSRIEAKTNGIESDWTMFVPKKDAVEVWLVTMTNRSNVRRRLQMFTYFEWNLGASPDWHREFHRSFIETSYDPKLRAMLATKRMWEVPSDRGHWNRDWEYIGFHACSEAPASYEGDKESFLGMYRNQRNPQAVDNAKLGKNTGNWLDAIASLQTDISLDPGASTTVVYLVGAGCSIEEVQTLVKSYGSVPQAQQALTDVQGMWKELLGRFHVETPDAEINLMLSPWLQYQAIVGRLWGRTGYYQTGGAFGFRDQLQDSQIFLPLDPTQTAAQIRLHARHQYKDGTVYHWWHPLSEVGLPTTMTDDLLWLPYIVVAYLEETGDKSLLKVKDPFLDDKKGAALYDHCVRAIDRVLKRMSKRGLPLIGAGDWNDGLSAVGLKWKGESVWLGQFLHRILLDFSKIAETQKDGARARRYTARAKKLRLSINKHGWDGSYYLGATKDNGEKIGSHTNTQGRIWLNTQTWSILADVADDARAQQVFDIVERELEGKNGTLLVKPAYSTPDREIGYLTRYAPGMRENGGVYTHAATWSIIAAAMLRRSDAAFRLFQKINPVRLGANPSEYVAEPYVTPGNIEGPDSRFYGKGGWTWYSGSAAWLFKAGVDSILGVRGSAKGLVVDPCIPKEWDHYSVKRLYRGAVYQILVVNPDHVSGGVRSVTIDGVPIKIRLHGKGVVLPIKPSDSEHTVLVTLGETKERER